MVLLASVVLALAPGAAGARVLVKLATLAPVGSTYHDILLQLGREWSDITGGEVELRIYAGGVAGDGTDVLRKMRIGQIHAATLTGVGGLSGIDARFRAFNVPLTYRNEEEFDHILTVMRPTLDGFLADHGFRALAWADAGWLRIFAREPAPIPADLQRQRLFIWTGADQLASALRDCGQRTVQLPVTDVHTGLQSGMVDAMTLPPLMALANQWFAEIPNMTAVRWVPLLAALVFTERTWRELPKVHHRALAEAAERAFDRMQEQLRRDEAEAVRVMEQHGLEVVAPEPGDVALWERAIRACFAPLIGGFIDRGIYGQIEKRLAALRGGG